MEVGIKFYCIHVRYYVYTGQPGWGIAWYINNTIVPELVVEIGRTYTFLIRGGNVSSDDANYHPFYITDYEWWTTA